MMDVRFQPMSDRVRCDNPGGCKSPFTAAHAMDELERELRLLDARDIVIESGHTRDQIRNDGWPRGGSSPRHQDVRLYFAGRHGPVKYECAVFSDWRANLRAIGLWLQRTRLAVEEWGIGAGGESYRGFAALPPAGDARAEAAMLLVRTALGREDHELARKIMHDATSRQSVYRQAAKAAHPDVTGGDDSRMRSVNGAYQRLEAEVK